MRSERYTVYTDWLTEDNTPTPMFSLASRIFAPAFSLTDRFLYTRSEPCTGVLTMTPYACSINRSIFQSNRSQKGLCLNQENTSLPRICSRTLRDVGRSNPSVTSRWISLLLSLSADVRSSDDVIAFEGPWDMICK